MVLRPNLLSIYRDQEEVSLLFSTPLCNVTAVAEREAAKSRLKSKSSLYRREYVFGIFTLSKNHYFEAPSPAEMSSWIATIDREIPSESSTDEGLHTTTNVAGNKKSVLSSESAGRPRISKHVPRAAQISSSRTSEEGAAQGLQTSRSRNSRSEPRPSRQSLELDGKPGRHNPAAIIPVPQLQGQAQHFPSVRPPRASVQGFEPVVNANPGRVILAGYLHCQTTRKGISSSLPGTHRYQKLWVVLRPHSICFYKSPDEHKVKNVLHTFDILAVAEIDLTSHHHKLRHHSSSSQKNTAQRAFQQVMHQSHIEPLDHGHRRQSSVSLSAISSDSESARSLPSSPSQPLQHPEVSSSSPALTHNTSKMTWGFQIITRDSAWQFRASDEASLTRWLGAVKTTANAARQGQGQGNVQDASDELNQATTNPENPPGETHT